MESTEEPPLTEEIPVTKEEKPATNNKPRNHTVLWLTLILLGCGLIWLLLYLFYFQFRENTDDAYVNGNKINVTSVVAGSPIAFYADETDLVEEGQLLVMLDPTPYRIAFEKELATLAATVLNVKQLFDNVKVSNANMHNKRIALEKARYDYENRQALVGIKAISNEDYSHAKDTFNTADQDLKQAVYQLQMAQDAVGKYSVENHPQIEAQKSAVREAYYRLRHCAIYAPATGFVAQRAVEVGQWVSSTSFLMAIIPKDYIWIDANFKETQLTYMRVGQPARVSIDLYPGVEFEGKVHGIASGTGSIFSLIPPQNATGNWIKIVQRLPVRILLDPEKLKKFPPRLGLSADVTVDITNTDLPKLRSVTGPKVVASTTVFDLDMSELERKMEKIVGDQLNSIVLEAK